MAQLLKDALKETFAGWLGDVPAAWIPVLKDVELAADMVGHDLLLDPWTGVVPVLKSRSATRALGSPLSAHVFRALDGLSPAQVRVVILGQDPYPDIAKATGRAFEQGDISQWDADSHRVSSSLRAVLQCAAAAKTHEDKYRSKTGWADLVSDLSAKKVPLVPPTQLFDRYQSQGVLWLNTTLSISLFRSEPSHQVGHQKFWAPFVDAILRHFVNTNQPVVFALWGGWAKSFREKLESWAKAAGTQAALAICTARHPVMDEFLTESNTLADVNAALHAWDETPIDWFPS